MGTKGLLEFGMITEVVLCVATLTILWRKRLTGRFSSVAALVAVWGCLIAISVSMLFFRQAIGLDKATAYNIYKSAYLTSSVVTHGLMLFVVYQIFRQAMAPFEGLRRFGTVVFKWVCSLAVAVAVGIALVPRAGGSGQLLLVEGQLEQGISILTICVLLFVCFASRYLGMTLRSHIFGISLGLGLHGTVGLATWAWVSVHGPQPLYSWASVVPTFAGVATILIWGGYLMIPEPERQLVLLPTTSPYFHWNQISEALGDNPGVVAVSGFTPEMLAPAERTMLSATAQRLRETANGAVASVEVSAQETAAIAMPR